MVSAGSGDMMLSWPNFKQVLNLAECVWSSEGQRDGSGRGE